MAIRKKYSLNICFRSYPPTSVSPQFGLEPKPTGTGTPPPTYPPGTYDFAGGPNLEVKITAPEQIDTNLFEHWEGDAQGSSPTITITMDSDKRIQACYGKTFKLSISAYPTKLRGRFSLKPRPQHLSPLRMPCFSGTYIYDEGTRVAINALEDIRTGWIFDYWGGRGGALTGSKNPDTITIDSDKIVTAYYREVTGLPPEGPRPM